MTSAQTGTDGECAGAIAFGCSSGGAEQLVGHLGHGADHDDGLLSGGNATRDDGGGTVNGGGVFHRGTAEFHDNQAHAFLVSTSWAKAHFHLEA